MKITQKLTLLERRENLSGRHVPLIAGGLVSLLFLLTLGIVTVLTAFDIRDEMSQQVQENFLNLQQQVISIPDTEMESTDEMELYSVYQKAMAASTELENSNYNFLSGSMLLSRDSQRVVESRNCMVCTFMRQNTGENMVVTLGFTPENSADVGAALWNYELEEITLLPETKIAITGYYDGYLFMTDTLEVNGLVYKSSIEPPEDVELITLRAGGLADPWDVCYIQGYSKNFGAKSYNAASFVDKWKTVDKLLKSASMKVAYDSGIWHIEERTQQGSIFTVKSFQYKPVRDEKALFGGGEMMLVYCVQYHPFGLAVKKLLGNGTLFGLLVAFLGVGMVLVHACSVLRRRELRGLQDELQRQNQALEYAKHAEASRREMTSSIAHELKTPIAVLSSYAEALQENIDAEKQSHYLRVIREETDRMDRMVLELLDLSRLEAGRYKLKREKFDLEVLTREIIEPLEPQIQEKHLHLDWQIGETEVDADRFRFGQVVENYMTNAITHTPEGGKIVLRIGMNHETFSVENQGRNIPAEQLSKVWETFWQGDASRNKRGSGLGLAICRSIMLLHGGSCRAENTSSGVRFSANVDAKRSAVIVNSMPSEKKVELQYPIAQSYTTVERMFLRLQLLNALELRREIRAGNIHCGTLVVDSLQDRLYPGYVVTWENFRITVTLDNRLKHQALLANQFQNVGRLDSNVTALGGGGAAHK